jgi:hypothetical protein
VPGLAATIALASASHGALLDYAYLGNVGVLARFEPEGCHALGTDLPHSPPSSDLSAASQLAAAATKRVRPRV